METKAADIARRKSPWWTWFLWPAGIAFLGLASLRAFLHKKEILRSDSLPAPTLAVGNLTFGGTGKTPFTIFLAQRLTALGAKPAVLLRGYGRKTSGARLVSGDDSEERVGEEALLYKRALPELPVAVGERRTEAAALVMPPPGVFLLDDAFQHLRVKRDADILLVDASRPNDLMAPPVGRLREPLGACGRAKLLVVTRGSYDDLPADFRRAWGGRPAIEASYKWEELLPSGSGSLASWRGRKVVALAGIGNPEAFLNQAREAGLAVTEAIILQDHARPNGRLVERAKKALRDTGAQALFTTEKDALKWAPVWPGPEPLVYPRLRAEIMDPQDHLGRLLSELLASRGKASFRE